MARMDGALVEAGLSGLPIVTTRVGIAEELEDGKDIAIADPNPEAFANAIFRIVSHNPTREMLKRNIETTLKQKLISKEVYLEHLKQNWQQTALRIPE